MQVCVGAQGYIGAISSGMSDNSAAPPSLNAPLVHGVAYEECRFPSICIRLHERLLAVLALNGAAGYPHYHLAPLSLGRNRAW